MEITPEAIGFYLGEVPITCRPVRSRWPSTGPPSPPASAHSRSQSRHRLLFKKKKCSQAKKKQKTTQHRKGGEDERGTRGIAAPEATKDALLSKEPRPRASVSVRWPAEGAGGGGVDARPGVWKGQIGGLLPRNAAGAEQPRSSPWGRVPLRSGA